MYSKSGNIQIVQISRYNVTIWRYPDCVPSPLLFASGIPCCIGQLGCPSANINTAAELIAGDANNKLARYPGHSAVHSGGLYKNCKLDCVLPSFQQYVDIPTRRANILDVLWQCGRCILCPLLSTAGSC